MLERQMDQIARRLEMSPAELRFKNLDVDFFEIPITPEMVMDTLETRQEGR